MSEPTLLLLHGLGANGAVWHDLVALLGDRTVLAPDLPGHGTGGTLTDYRFERIAEAVAATLDPTRRYRVLGHSFGAVVGVAMADPRLGLSLVQVTAIGIKVSWSEAEQAKAAELGRKPVTWFDTRDAAMERYLKVAGLLGLIDTDHPSAVHGVTQENGRWRTTMDPAVVRAGAPDMPTLIAAASCPIVMARGEQDHMCTEEHLTQLEAKTGGPAHITLPGLGHNPHVEDPAAVLGLVTG